MTEQQTSPDPRVISTAEQLAGLGKYEYGWADSDVAGATARRGLNEEVVRDISARKHEPEWMLDLRLKGLRLFQRKPMPSWGADLSGIDFDNIKYFVRSTEKQATSWDDLPADIKNTYDRLGIPEAEKQRLIAGVAAQYESEVVYHKIREDLEQQGVLFLDTDTGLKEHEDIYREYFSTVIPVGDNKFAALNTAVWSGGSFIYVPKGVNVEIPLQAYFRINTENMGQFERTLIIVDEGAYVHYVEGCTAPIYSSDSLHSAVVEIIVKKGARCRYTTIQNWSNNVYNLVTKRAVAHEGATMEWIDGNIGSKVTMKYPSVYMTGEHAKGEVLSVAMAGEGQHQDAGAKMVHAAPNTSSTIISKSIARGGGRTSYRGLVQVLEGSQHSKSTVKCDALLVDTISRSDTYPYVDIREDDVSMGHEATVSKISDDQLFYLMSRGLTEDEAMAMIVRGFIEPIAKELPMEYALELNRLIEMQMEGAVGSRAVNHRDPRSALRPSRRRCVRTMSPTSPRSPGARRSGASRPSSACAGWPRPTARRRTACRRSTSTANCPPASPCPVWIAPTPGSAASSHRSTASVRWRSATSTGPWSSPWPRVRSPRSRPSSTSSGPARTASPSATRSSRSVPWPRPRSSSSTSARRRWPTTSRWRSATAPASPSLPLRAGRPMPSRRNT